MQTVFGSLTFLGIALIAYPFAPLALYTIAPSAPSYPYRTELLELPQAELGFDGAALPAVPTTPPSWQNDANAAKPRPIGNRLVIPKIGVDIAVVDGPDERALVRGGWRLPQTSADPKESNMVISAHRFRYRPPSTQTFYLLDKLAVGDTFILYWNDKEYDYRVTDARVVAPSAVGILAPTSAPQVTLFTCTPLFSTAQRLVVVGELLPPRRSASP